MKERLNLHGNQPARNGRKQTRRKRGKQSTRLLDQENAMTRKRSSQIRKLLWTENGWLPGGDTKSGNQEGLEQGRKSKRNRKKKVSLSFARPWVTYLSKKKKGR